MSRFLDQIRKAKGAREQAADADQAAAGSEPQQPADPASPAPAGGAETADSDRLFPAQLDESVVSPAAAPREPAAGEAADSTTWFPEASEAEQPGSEPDAAATDAVSETGDYAALDALERILEAEAQAAPPTQALDTVPSEPDLEPEPVVTRPAPPEAKPAQSSFPSRAVAVAPSRLEAEDVASASERDDVLYPDELSARTLPPPPAGAMRGNVAAAASERNAGSNGLGEASAIRVSRRTRRTRSETPVPGPEPDAEFVGRIPRVTLRPNKQVLSHYEPQNHVCEEYRLLGKNLLHTLAATAGDPKLGKVVTLSSSARGEGKTLTCVNLANTLSQDLRDRVLLIDADLRHPRVSRYLGLPSSRGLNDLLATDAPEAILEDSLLRTESGLHLLASAAHGDNPAPLLDSPRMVRLLDLLRQHYSVVIVDTPPVLLATDALTLGVRSDGMLLLLRARKTQREQVQEARQRIARLEIRMLGYVINNVRSFLPRIWRKYYNYNY